MSAAIRIEAAKHRRSSAGRIQYWMITDAWKGLCVYHFTDLLHWEAQPKTS
jgi:hypothetical protein